MLALAAPLAPAAAQDARDRGTLSVTHENDTFGFTDRNYSSGLRLGWVTVEKRPAGPERALVRVLAGERPASLRRSYALGHSIFTPRDTFLRDAPPDQHPYAAYLRGEYGLVVEQADRLDRASVQLGIVGPSAGGDWLQNGVHDLLGEAPVRGWDDQVGDEVVVSVAYDTQRRVASRPMGSLTLDVVPSAGVRLGNFQTYAQAGALVRLAPAGGWGPPRIAPALPGVGVVREGGASWSVFAGGAARVVAHDITLEGSFLDGDGDPSVEAERVVGDLQAGFTVRVLGADLAYTHVLRTRTFETQNGAHDFGSLTLSVLF